MAPPNPNEDRTAAAAAGPGSSAVDANGISLDTVGGLVQAVKDDPSKAAAVFSAETVWQGGTLCRVSVRDGKHTYVLDEPSSLGGTNRGPNMVEEVALAVGSGLAVGYVLGASSRGYEVRNLGVDVTGALNLGKFLGVSNEHSAGFSAVNATVRLEARGKGAGDDELRALHEHVVRTSPVGSIVSRATDVSVEFADRDAPAAPGAEALVTNGVPLEAVAGLVSAVTDDESKRDTKWTTSTSWAGAGFQCRNTVRDHERVIDEPPVLSGADGGVTPLESVLGAFSACLVVGVALQAASRGIKLRGLRVGAEGHIDLQPFLGVADGNAGFSRVTAAIHADAPDATDAELRDLVSYVVETSPVGSILREAVPFNVDVELVAAAGEAQ